MVFVMYTFVAHHAVNKCHLDSFEEDAFAYCIKMSQGLTRHWHLAANVSKDIGNDTR